MNNDLNIRIATAKGYKIVKQDDYFVVTFPNGNMKSFYEHELRKILKDYSLIQNAMELVISYRAKIKDWIKFVGRDILGTMEY